MVLGLRSKNKKGASVHVDYIIHIQEIKPWPPSQSLKSVRSVVLQWENGDSNYGSTNPVTPSLGASAAEGKIEFNESFKLQVTLSREGSTKGNSVGTFQKNVLEFNLYEPRRDKTVKGQHLGSVVVDLAEYGIIKEAVSVSIPVNCKRSFRNTAQPLLYVKIQPFDKDSRSSSSRESLSKEASLDKDGKESVSALMNEEYAEEAEIASFTDDDVSSHSSFANSSSTLEASTDLPASKSTAEQQHHENTLEAGDKQEVGALEVDLPLQSVPAKDEMRPVTTAINLNGAVINQNERSPESSPEDLSRDSESSGDGSASLSTPASTNLLLILEKSDTSGATSSTPMPESIVEDIKSSEDNEVVVMDDKAEEVKDKMVDCRGKENTVENPVKKESTIVITDKIEITDIDFGENLKNVINDELEQNIDKDGISQESQNGPAEFSSSRAADFGFAEVNTEKKTGNRTEVKTEQIQNHLVEADCLTDHADNISIARVQQKPATQQHSYLQGSRKTSFTSDLTVSNWRSFGERGNGNLTNDRLKSMKLSVRSPLDSKGTITYGPNDEDVKEVDVLEDVCNGINSATDDGIDDQESTSSSSDKVRHSSRINRNGFSDKKVRELELRIELLKGELREAAAIEMGLYSIVAEHGSSSHKVHTPARRLSRLYIHASKQWSRERRANAARSAVSGLVVAAKACGNDVPRLTFWLSNSVVLRAIVAQTMKSSDIPKSFSPYSAEHGSKTVPKKKFSPLKWESIRRKKENLSFIEEFDDWENPDTFISALEKIETWIFSRIIESVWWQTLTPHMQSANGNELKMRSKKSYGRTPSGSDHQRANSSIGIWKKAFKDASERLCPVRAGGHECGCLPMLARLVMEQCVARLDVAMFNAILRESDDEIPTDPVSDPISDPKVLPIPSGKTSFGSGAQLKNAIGNWSRWLTDLFGMDLDDTPQNEDKQDDDRLDVAASFKSFNLLNALSDLLMLPKDMLLEKTIRREVCPTFSASMIKRILDSFLPDEFCPDLIPDALLEALDSEDPLESSEERIRNVPCDASPIIYSPPSVASVESIIGDVQSAPLLRRSGSSVVRKCHTSDDELDELDSPLASILSDKSSPPTAKPKDHCSANVVRYQLLREVWRDD